MGEARTVRGVLEPLRGALGWVVVRVPFDVKAAWPTLVRRRVVVGIGGEVYRTSLFPDAERGGHFLLINKKMQRAAGVQAGGMVEFTVEPDDAPRPAKLSPEFARLLKADKALYGWFGEQSESMRREIAKWVDDAKTAETRRRRAEQMTERLMLAMEGETTLPPVLERAFAAQPAARRGWEAMTVTQRRGHLLGIFYYQSPEAREKRVGKAVEEALRRA